MIGRVTYSNKGQDYWPIFTEIIGYVNLHRLCSKMTSRYAPYILLDSTYGQLRLGHTELAEILSESDFVSDKFGLHRNMQKCPHWTDRFLNGLPNHLFPISETERISVSSVWPSCYSFVLKCRAIDLVFFPTSSVHWLEIRQMSMISILHGEYKCGPRWTSCRNLMVIELKAFRGFFLQLGISAFASTNVFKLKVHWNE